MPAETEAKIRLPTCRHLEDIEKRLLELGAVHMETRVEEDTYYQHPCRDFAETDEALRLRRSNGRAELTYKGPKRLLPGGAKTREEETARIEDAEAMHRILERLGFRPVAVVRKERSYWLLGDVLVTLDKVENLGCFMEAEYQGPGGPGEAREAIETVLRMLGAENYERIPVSYLELLLAAR